MNKHVSPVVVVALFGFFCFLISVASSPSPPLERLHRGALARIDSNQQSGIGPGPRHVTVRLASKRALDQVWVEGGGCKVAVGSGAGGAGMVLQILFSN